MSLLSQFVHQHNVDGYDVICVVEALARQARVSTDSILAVALVDRTAADYLLGCVVKIQQKSG
jgi:hypothetical protein